MNVQCNWNDSCNYYPIDCSNETYFDDSFKMTSSQDMLLVS